MKYLTPVPKQFVDSSGVPYSNGTVSVYYSGTEELAEIWRDADGESLLLNPAKLDSHGSWICYVNGEEALDYIVQDKDEHVVATFEKVVPGGSDGSGNVARTTVTSEDGSIDIQESYSEETRTRRFDLSISDSVVSVARFSETGARALPSGTYAYSSLTESRIVGDDILLRDGHLALNKGTYHLTLSILLENSSVDENYYEAAISVLGISRKALWDNSFVHSESMEVSLDIVVDADNTVVVPEISGLPSGISCGLSNMDVHKICVGPKGDRGEVGPMPDLDQSVPDNSEATESAPSTAAVFNFAISGVKVNGVELEKDADKKVDVPVPTASSTTPAMDGVASAGSEEHWAKGDHVHPTDTSREAVSNKVTTVRQSGSADDTHFPSEAAVRSAIDSAVSDEETRAMAAEAAAKTVVTAGENCSVTKTTASDGHDVYTINADGKPQVQADWNQSDSSKVDYIKNKLKLSNAIDSTSTTEAATPKAVKDAYDELNSKIVARAVFLSASEWSAQSLLPGDPAKVYYVEDGTGEDAYTVYVWKESTSAYVEVDESSIDLDGYWHDGPSSSGTGNVVTGMSLGNDGVPVLEKNLTAATLDSNGTVPVSQIPDSIKDKIAFIEGSISRTIVGAQYVYTVTCSTTYSEITQLLSSGKVPICKFIATFGNSSRTWLFYYHVTFDNLKHSFGSVDNNDTSGDEASYVSCVYVKTDNSWTFIEIANYDRSYWTDALALKQNTISDLSTIRSGASAGASALQPSGDGSNLSVTPDGSSTGYDLGNSTTLKSFAQKFKNLVASLKALAFKDTADKTDLSQAVQTSLGKADTALQAHQTVTNNDPTLAYGTKSTIGSVGSTSLSLTLPSLDSSVSGASTSTTTAPCTKAVYDVSNVVIGSMTSAGSTTASNYGLLADFNFSSYNAIKEFGVIFDVSYKETSEAKAVGVLYLRFRRNTNATTSDAVLKRLHYITIYRNCNPLIDLQAYENGLHVYIYGKTSPETNRWCTLQIRLRESFDYDGSFIPLSTYATLYPAATTTTTAPTYTSVTITKSELAVKNHASTGTEFGAADATHYGHTMLSTSIATDSASNAKAATPKAVADWTGGYKISVNPGGTPGSAANTLYFV